VESRDGTKAVSENACVFAVLCSNHIVCNFQVGDAYIVVGGLDVLSKASSCDNSRVSRGGSAYYGARSQAHLVGSGTATRVHLDKIFHLAQCMLKELEIMRALHGLPLHMRIGVHCGDVVTGIVGSQRPRFCVIGKAVTEAEIVESSCQLDCVTCTAAALQHYIASPFEFSEAPGLAGRLHPFTSSVVSPNQQPHVLAGGLFLVRSRAQAVTTHDIVEGRNFAHSQPLV
jgi:class 3 adenylate cyclase